MIIIYHMHGVGIDIITNNLKKNKKTYYEISYLKKNFYNNIYDFTKDADDIKIITVIRDPIARNFECYSNHNKSTVNNFIKNKNFKSLTDNFIKNYNHNIPDNWLNSEFMKQLNLNKNDLKTFNKNNGFIKINKKNINTLILTYENIHKNNELIREFLDIPIFYNKVGFNNRYRKYMKLIKNHIPEHFLQKIWQLDIINFFYNKDEIIDEYKIYKKIINGKIINDDPIPVLNLHQKNKFIHDKYSKNYYDIKKINIKDKILNSTKDKNLNDIKNENLDDVKDKNLDNLKDKNLNDIKNENLDDVKDKNLNDIKDKNLDDVKDKNLDDVKDKNLNNIKNENLDDVKNKHLDNLQNITNKKLNNVKNKNIKNKLEVEKQLKKCDELENIEESENLEEIRAHKKQENIKQLEDIIYELTKEISIDIRDNISLNKEIKIIKVDFDEIFTLKKNKYMYSNNIDSIDNSDIEIMDTNYFNNYNNKIAKDVAYIFLYRKDCQDRYNNLLFMIRWLKEKMNNIYTVYLVEINKSPKLDLNEIYSIDSNVKYYFLYCDSYFNRGWGYNCMCKNICKEKVVILADTDLIFDNNILSLIKNVHNETYYFASPYKFVYQTKPNQKKEIIKNFSISFLKNNIRNFQKSHYTFGGGILIANREKFLEIGGFEEYDCYGMEDRSIDVMIFNSFDRSKIFLDNKLYFHLHHPTSGKLKYLGRINRNQEHLKKYFGCFVGGNHRGQNIHSICRHKNKKITDTFKDFRYERCGDIGLYKRHKEIPNNGISLKILIFCDNISPIKKYKGFLYSSYCYTTETYIKPFKHTTILDFIDFMEHNNNFYDVIILDIGREDFKFRPIEELNKIYSDIALRKNKNKKKTRRDKKSIIKKLVPKIYLEKHFNSNIIKDDIKYNNMYSLEILDNFIIPYLCKFKNLIWINNNSDDKFYHEKIVKSIYHPINYSQTNITMKINEIIKNNKSIIIIKDLNKLSNYEDIKKYQLFCIDQNYNKFYNTKYYMDYYFYNSDKSDKKMKYEFVENKILKNIFIFNKNIKPIDNKLIIINKIQQTLEDYKDSDREYFCLNNFIEQETNYQNAIKIIKILGINNIINFNDDKE